MRKRPVSKTWLYAAGVAALIAVLSWVQFSIKALGNELEQSNADRAALAAQVRSLGGQPVAEGKPGAQGDQGPQGIQGPPGIQGPRGPIGVTGQSPVCLLLPSKCVGPKGAAGADGEDGTEGPKGDTGAAGEKGDQGPAGVDGKDGTDGKPGADGTDGTNGADGKDGRGVQSVTCQPDGTWLITYTDTTTSTAEGPCRVQALKVGN